MQRLTSRFKRSLKRHQTGQAIVLLAIGFVVLLGFVGIVTDLSLLFVRYNALSRAIDSAAVAAAGQFSRKESDQVNFERTTFAARQFLEFHGIDPAAVLVDTCTSVPAAWDRTAEQVNNRGADPEDPSDDFLETNVNYTEYERIRAIPEANRSPADQDLFEEIEYQYDVYDAVCDDGSGRKLVRVQASVEVPTTFMNLFGQETFTLTAAAVSETASLDVVIVLDVSESMLYDTTMDDYDYFFFEDNGMDARWYRYLPPDLDGMFAAYQAAGGTITDINEFRLAFLSEVTPGEISNNTGSDGDGDGFNDPTQLTVDGTLFSPGFDRYVVGTDGTTTIPVTTNPQLTGIVGGSGTSPYAENFDMRQDCRIQMNPVRGFAASAAVTNGYELVSEYDDPDLAQNSQSEQLTQLLGGTPYTYWNNMFESNFRFYGCCNDPAAARLDIDADDLTDIDIRHDSSEYNPGVGGDPLLLSSNDFAFYDLVCQPFKQARDASTRFLYNVDFLAGDRVALVTFDRSAMIVDPDGAGPEPAMMDDRELAVDLLNRAVGVRAEPNFYHSDSDDNGISAFEEDEGVGFLWTGYSAGIDENGYSTELDDSQYEDVPVGAVTRAGLVFDSCGYDNAALPRQHSLWAYDEPSILPYLGHSALAGGDGTSEDRMLPPFRSEAGWVPALEDAIGADSTLWGFRSYERSGQCRGTNVGAALRQANNALLDPDTVRTEGAVWVIVLLSDGAAGATDPIAQGNLIEPGNPYARDGGASDFSAAPDAEPALYGAYGFCPFGSVDDPIGYASADGRDPFCADQNPSERHYCYTEVDGQEGKTAVEIRGVNLQTIGADDDYNDGTSVDDDACETEYDADDYARDWADFVSLSRGTSSLTLLPTIFTIGFNLEYDNSPDAGLGQDDLCEANLQSCLGEELLRYIADVGDNNEVNNDYPTSYSTPGTTDGDRFTGLSYGNYWNAPDEDELTDVFDEIAGRLFTRLTG